jgi:hypothetical protein
MSPFWTYAEDGPSNAAENGLLKTHLQEVVADGGYLLLRCRKCRVQPILNFSFLYPAILFDENQHGHNIEHEHCENKESDSPTLALDQ